MKHFEFPSIDYQAETLILANGEFPSSEPALSILNNASFLVCCDGATNQLIKNSSRIPDVIIGDCDSVSKENAKRFADRIYQISEQDTNDLTKAVNYCCKEERKRITILGATGKREDHTLGNIGLLAHYLNIPNSEFQMITNFGVLTAIDSAASFASFKGQQVSIFNLYGSKITTSNLKYPLQDQALYSLWEGTLNESLADYFSLQTEAKVIVFREF